jgi:flagellar hook-length control protein FliK
MNQVNQLYTYIQIPLKLQHQNANSELFVYTNKKNLKDREGELSALLHLDLDDLGATDIHIKLNKNNVTANFFLTNDFAVQLLQSNMDDLTQRLENKGYQCSVSFEKRQQDKTVDFVEDFLEREKPTGTLHRYSFDVMA